MAGCKTRVQGEEKAERGKEKALKSRQGRQRMQARWMSDEAGSRQSAGQAAREGASAICRWHGGWEAIRH